MCKNLEELEFRLRVTEGLLSFPINLNHIYSARLAIAAKRPEEALVYMMRHLRQQKSLHPSEDQKNHFWRLVLDGKYACENDPSLPKPKKENPADLRYSQILFDTAEVDLFLDIGRKVIDNGRKSM